MARTVVISETEKHPLPSGVARQGEDKSAVVFFGLHNERGENVIYSTRVTDKLFDVLSKYDLVSYRGDQRFRDQISGYRQFVRPDVTLDMVGVAYHIRKLWPAEKYMKLICDIADAIGEDQSKDGKEVDVIVKPKSGEDPAVNTPIPGVTGNENPAPPTVNPPLDNPPVV